MEDHAVAQTALFAYFLGVVLWTLRDELWRWRANLKRRIARAAEPRRKNRRRR